MNPGNFPERKNKRRKRALEQLKAQAKKNPSKELTIIIENTEAKIVEDASSVRTKKDRGKAGK